MAYRLVILGLELLYYRMVLVYYRFLVKIGVPEKVLVGIRAKLREKGMVAIRA